MTLKPIRTDSDYRAALSEIERLFTASPGTPEGDQLDVWTTLVAAYEEQHFQIPAPNPVDANLYFMESRGLSAEDLEPFLGDSQCVAEVLSRKRALTVEMIRNLKGGLGIPTDLLIQPYAVIETAA